MGIPRGKLYSSDGQRHRRWALPLTVLVAFGVVGLAVQLAGRAAGPFVSSEAEAGTRTANARLVTDTAASGGSAIRFGAGAPAIIAGGKGIMSMGAPLAAHTGYVDSTTAGLNFQWDDLETADQVFNGPGWGRLDTLLASPGIDTIRLRVYSGRYAPDFVKRLGGPAISGDGFDCTASGGIAVINPYDSTPTNTVGGCVPYFWLDPYLNEYAELMAEIQRRYGSNPKAAEIVASGCSTTYAEPFYRAHAHTASNQRLWQAGLNRATDFYCHDRTMAIHQNTFPTKLTSLAINPWEIIVDPATDADARVNDWSATYNFAQKWRGILGNKLVLQNNGWGENEGCPAGGLPTTNVYCYLKSTSQPKGFQSETWPRLGDSLAGDSLQGWYDALEHAISDGACFIESTDNGYRNADPARAAGYDARLQANCQQ